MLTDKNLTFSEQQQVIGAADAVVEASKYLGWPKQDPKALHPVDLPGIVKGYLKSIVTTDFVGAGATLSIGLYTSADDVTYKLLVATPPRTIAELASLKEPANIPLPTDLQRYLKVKYTIGDAEITAGALSSYIVLDPMPA